MKKMPQIFLFTGAPRSKKTCTALEEATTALKNRECSYVVYVARTIKSMHEAVEKIDKFFDPNHNIFVTEHIGKGKACPIISPILSEQDFFNTDYCLQCPLPDCKERTREISREKWIDGFSATMNERRYAYRTIEDKKEELIPYLPENCPRAVVKKRVKEIEKHFILTTYEGLKSLVDDLSISDTIFIFDEARHIESMNNTIIKSLGKNTNKSFEKILEDFIQELEDVKPTLQELNRQKGLQNNIENNITRFQEELKRLRKGSMKADILNRMLFENVKKEEKEFVKKDIEIISENIKQKKKDGVKPPYCKYGAVLDYKRELSKNRTAFALTNFQYIMNAYQQNRSPELKSLLEVCIMIQKLEGKTLALDLIQDENNEQKNISIVAREMLEGDIESREPVTTILETAKKVYLVDSTPWPEGFRKFWLGKDYNIDVRVFPTEYNFNLVVENTSKSIKQRWWGDHSVSDRIEIGTIRKVMQTEGKAHVFARSKKEAENLKKVYAPIKDMVEVHYSRGSESEAVQLEGFVISHGFPLQNINSEKYRELSIRAMTNRSNSLQQSKEIMKDYRGIKARQELIQQTFRCANPSKKKTDSEKPTFSALWRYVTGDTIIESTGDWCWLSDINKIVLRKNLREGDKVRHFTDALLLGKTPELTETDERIDEEILKTLSLGEKSFVELSKKVRGDTGQIIAALKRMDGKKIEMEDYSHGFGSRPSKKIRLKTPKTSYTCVVSQNAH